MTRICLLLLLALTLVMAGCKTADPGDREFVPGKGWVTHWIRRPADHCFCRGAAPTCGPRAFARL